MSNNCAALFDGAAKVLQCLIDPRREDSTYTVRLYDSMTLTLTAFQHALTSANSS